MEKFRREMMSVEVLFTCVNDDYFDDHFRDYYDYLGFDISKSEVHGVYGRYFYKLKSTSDIVALRLDMNFYYRLPSFICKSEIY